MCDIPMRFHYFIANFFFFIINIIKKFQLFVNTYDEIYLRISPYYPTFRDFFTKLKIHADL